MLPGLRHQLDEYNSTTTIARLIIEGKFAQVEKLYLRYLMNVKYLFRLGEVLKRMSGWIEMDDDMGNEVTYLIGCIESLINNLNMYK